MSKERSPRSSNTGVLKGLLFGGLTGALIGGLVAWMGPLLIDSDLSENRLVQRLAQAEQILTAWDLFALPVLILIVLGTHEVGHLIGGLSQGMRFLLLIVGPFGWYASVSGVRFDWNTNLALMGGIAATVPTKMGADLRRQLLVLIAGGPVASLLLTIFAVALASVSDPRFAAYCVFVAATSFGIFLVTLIPVRSAGFMSDGLQIIDVLRGGSAVAERTALMRIFAQSLVGIRPRDWGSSAVNELSRIESGDPLRSTGSSLYLLYRSMDCQNNADMLRYWKMLEDGVDGYPSGFKQSIFVELAICAWLAGHTDAVRQYLKASKGGIVEKSRRLLADAALAKLEGRGQDCERYRLLAIKALEKASDSGLRKLTEDQIAMLTDGS
ncbi:MAG: M50 family metallopeptidase [Rhodocyclaceae bacterium]|nr:M50 family metallopeptidase [Rhodocyclaceae bacterium]MCA3083425.1 M50 family metallopeptidase [Rhodocyclaceae bacterium]